MHELRAQAWGLLLGTGFALPAVLGVAGDGASLATTIFGVLMVSGEHLS